MLDRSRVRDYLPLMDPAPPTTERSGRAVLWPTLVWLYSIGLVLWAVFAVSGYRGRYSKATDSWQMDATRVVELTVVPAERELRSCASDVFITKRLHCGKHADGSTYGGPVSEDTSVLQPLEDVRGNLFLAAGLWAQPLVRQSLGQQRFNVLCNLTVYGAAHTAVITTPLHPGPKPLEQAVAVGSIHGCSIVQ